MLQEKPNMSTRSAQRIANSCLVVAQVGILAMAVSWGPSSVHAQFRSSVTAPTSLPAFLPAPRELTRELSRAVQDIEQEEYVDAITRLDFILNGDGTDPTQSSEDYFLPSQQGKPRVSLKQEADRLISTLPKKGRQAYELAYGTEAAKKLERAVANRDYDAIGELARRYGNTNAGEEAALLLGRKHLLDGNAVEAILHFQRLARSQHAAERLGDELKLLQVTALKLANRDAEAQRWLNDVQVDAASPLAANLDGADPASLLVAVPHAMAAKNELKDWPMFGGNLTRSGSTNAGMPMRAFAWDVATATPGDDRKTLSDLAKTQHSTGAMPALHPLLVGNFVLARSTDYLWGAPMQHQGKRLWNFPAWETSTSLSRARRDALIKQRVWSNSLYGQVSSDGELVFLISSIPDSLRSRSNTQLMTNELVALDLPGEGKLKWIVGKDDANHEPKLRGMFFLGAPLPIGDSLFCVGEQNGEIRVMELQKSNGKLLWSQQLAHFEARSGYDRSDLRRLAGLNLAYADGILVCPTSTGGAIAIELSQRRFMWGYEYATRVNRIGRRPMQRPPVEHWRDNWVIIDQGRVVLTPWDADEMYCLDLLTGESFWKKPVQRGSGLYVAGVHKDQIIVVGKKEVSAIGIDDGKPRWKCALRGSPSGRGIKTDDHYLLATTESELIKIDLDNGKIVQSMSTIDPLGNLIASEDMIISQNSLYLRAFYQQDKLRQKVTQRLADNPNNPWALEHEGILLLEEGKRREGLEKLQQAIASYPILETPGLDYLAKKRLVDETFELLLKEDGPEALELASRIKAFLPESRKQEYWRVMTVRNLKEGRIIESFDSNLVLFLDSLNEASRLVLEPQLMAFPDRQIRADRWHRSMFRSIWQDADNSQRQQLEQLVAKSLERATDMQRDSLVEAMQDLPVMQSEHLNVLAAKIAKQGKTPYVEGPLLRLSESEQPHVAARATALLARLYRSSGQMLAASSQYRRLRDEFADSVVDFQLTGAAVVEAAIAENATLQGYLDTATVEDTWGYGVLEAVREETKGESPRVSAIYGYSRSSDTLNGFTPVGSEHGREWNAGMQWVLTQPGPGVQLEIRDPMGQTITSLGTMFTNSRRGREPKILTFGHLAVGAFDSAVVALNGLRDGTETVSAELWREAGPPTLGAASSPVRDVKFGQLGLSRRVEYGPQGRSPISLGSVSDRGVILRRSGDLICFDPATGETLWQRDDLAVEAEVWGDDEFVFAHVDEKFPKGGGNARVFSVFDGTELESRPAPNQAERVRTFGRHVLTWKRDVGQSLDLNLDPNQVVEDILKARDPRPQVGPKQKAAFKHLFEMRDLFNRNRRSEWSRSYSDLARAAWISYTDLAVFDPSDGKLEIISVLDGKSLLRTQIECELERVDSFTVEKQAGLYIVSLGQNSDGKVGGEVRYKSPIAIRPLQNLEVYGFSPDGEMVWGVPAKLMNFRPLPTFAEGLPLLIFARKNETNASRSKRAFETVILDVRDGHVAFRNADLFLGNSQFKVLGHRGEGQVDLLLPSQNGKWTLSFTNEPRAPSVPYGYATNQLSKPKRKFLRAVVDTLFPGRRDAEEDTLDEEAPAP